MVVAKGCGEGKMGSCHLMGIKFHLRKISYRDLFYNIMAIITMPYYAL